MTTPMQINASIAITRTTCLSTLPPGTDPSPWRRSRTCRQYECGGGTAVVPRTGDDDPAYPWPIVQTPGVGGLRYVNDRVRAEDISNRLTLLSRELLYAREESAQYRWLGVTISTRCLASRNAAQGRDSAAGSEPHFSPRGLRVGRYTAPGLGMVHVPARPVHGKVNRQFITRAARSAGLPRARR